MSNYSFTPFVYVNWKKVDLYLPLSTRQFGKKCFSLCVRRSSQVLTVANAMEVSCIVFLYRSLPCLKLSTRVFETRSLTVYILMTFFDNMYLRHTYFLLSLFFQGILNLYDIYITSIIYYLLYLPFIFYWLWKWFPRKSPKQCIPSKYLDTYINCYLQSVQANMLLKDALLTSGLEVASIGY